MVTYIFPNIDSAYRPTDAKAIDSFDSPHAGIGVRAASNDLRISMINDVGHRIKDYT